tara:strand:+ start:3120 stop:3398 length:279 start_codon:yes stop_codon:yes gene_type:complete
MKIIFYTTFIGLLFNISFFFSNGNIVDSKLKHHKFTKENYEKIFYLKNKESVNIYCTKHSENECVKKLKYQQHNGGGTKNKFRITKAKNTKK